MAGRWGGSSSPAAFGGGAQRTPLRAAQLHCAQKASASERSRSRQDSQQPGEEPRTPRDPARRRLQRSGRGRTKKRGGATSGPLPPRPPPPPRWAPGSLCSMAPGLPPPCRGRDPHAGGGRESQSEERRPPRGRGREGRGGGGAEPQDSALRSVPGEPRISQNKEMPFYIQTS